MANRAGLRPGIWNTSWVEQATAIEDASIGSYNAALAAYAQALDLDEPEKAAEYLARAAAVVRLYTAPVPTSKSLRRGWGFPSFEHVEGSTKSREHGRFRANYLAEDAYFTASYRRDAGQARMLLHRVVRSQIKPHEWLRAEAAVLLAEGHYPEARQQALDARAHLAQLPPSGVRLLEGEQLEAIARLSAQQC